MLVLALEFSRGCTARTRGRDSVTTPRRISQNGKRPEQSAQPGRARGDRSPPARVRPGHEGREAHVMPRSSRRARLDSRALPTSGSDERRRDITGNDRNGHSLKTE